MKFSLKSIFFAVILTVRNANSDWILLGDEIDGAAAHDVFGHSVSLSSDGTKVAIGAIGNDANGSQAGHVRVYQLNGSQWTQIGQDILGEAVNDYSGFSVSLSFDGARVAIGAYGNNGNGSDSGHVRVYQLNGSQWVQIGQEILGEASGDMSGYSVSLSSDGTRVAIGAFNNDGNGNDSGHARVYEFNGSLWTQIGQDLDGAAAGDSFGHSVSLSSDGTKVAIGAYGHNGNGSYSGHVQV